MQLSKTVLCKIVAVLVLGLSTANAQESELLLWPADHKANEGTNPVPAKSRFIRVKCKPAVVPYLPEQPAASKAAVVICPGGGYSGLAIEHEGYQVAEWFNERGIAAFVLKYRCGGGENMYPVPQADAMRAMQLVRSKSEQYGIDPDKVGIMGFSAGGHLASSVTTLGKPADESAEDEIARQASRPDFAILMYPVISMLSGEGHRGSRNNLLGAEPSEEIQRQLSTHLQVTSDTPHTFLMHTFEDKVVPLKGVLNFASALNKHNVPCELHVVPKGPHGFGMNKYGNDRYLRDWPSLLEAWLKEEALLETSESL